MSRYKLIMPVLPDDREHWIALSTLYNRQAVNPEAGRQVFDRLLSTCDRLLTQEPYHFWDLPEDPVNEIPAARYWTVEVIGWYRGRDDAEPSLYLDGRMALHLLDAAGLTWAESHTTMETATTARVMPEPDAATDEAA